MNRVARCDGLLFLGVLSACMVLTLAHRLPGTMLSTILLGTGVVLFGLPHGSLDVLVARRALHLKTISSLALFLAGYLLLSAVYGFLWWQSPMLAFAAFLTLSAFHFGTDWERRGTLTNRLAYGFAVVTVPAAAHGDEVLQIYKALGVSAPEIFLLAARVIVLPACVLMLVAACRQRRSRARDLPEAVGILLGGLVLPPTLYFLCYFCFLHSPRHLLATAKEEHLGSFGQILRHTAAPTLVVVAAATAFLASPAVQVTVGRLLQVIFVGLAVLTVPHMLLKVLTGLPHQPGDRQAAQAALLYAQESWAGSASTTSRCHGQGSSGSEIS